MAEGPNQQQQQQDSWSEVMTNFAEATRHSLTASRLLTAGAVAFAAAATAYMWDAERRNGLFQSSKKLSDDMLGWWGMSAPRGSRTDGGSGNG